MNLLIKDEDEMNNISLSSREFSEWSPKGDHKFHLLNHLVSDRYKLKS